MMMMMMMMMTTMMMMSQRVCEHETYKTMEHYAITHCAELSHHLGHMAEVLVQVMMDIIDIRPSSSIMQEVRKGKFSHLLLHVLSWVRDKQDISQ
jgi:hypothetical protein